MTDLLLWSSSRSRWQTTTAADRGDRRPMGRRQAGPRGGTPGDGCPARRAAARLDTPAKLHGWSVTARAGHRGAADRKSTRLNSSHTVISYAVFCLKKKK